MQRKILIWICCKVKAENLTKVYVQELYYKHRSLMHTLTTSTILTDSRLLLNILKNFFLSFPNKTISNYLEFMLNCCEMSTKP